MKLNDMKLNELNELNCELSHAKSHMEIMVFGSNYSNLFEYDYSQDLESEELNFEDIEYFKGLMVEELENAISELKELENGKLDNSNDYIENLSNENIKRLQIELFANYVNNGYEIKEFNEHLENALSSRLSDLSDTINIKNYIKG